MQTYILENGEGQSRVASSPLLLFSVSVILHVAFKDLMLVVH